jgi:hypothetical protein
MKIHPEAEAGQWAGEGGTTMTKRGRKGAAEPARPIKTKRDYERASSVVKRLSGQADLDSSAELRLQSLLRELDKFDDPEDYASENKSEDYDYSGPRRRWSDDVSGGD